MADDLMAVEGFGLPAHATEESPLLDPDIGIPLPDAPTPRLRTRINPEGAIPGQGKSFSENFSGSIRSNTPFGSAADAASSRAAGWLESPERKKLVEAAREDSVAGRLSASALKQKDEVSNTHREELKKSLYQQIAYDTSDTVLTWSGAAGALLGAAADPTNLLGFGSLLTKVAPKVFAGRQIATIAGDAAISNTVTDPVVQVQRMAGGAQDKYDIGQTLAAPVVGAAGGALIGGAAKVLRVLPAQAPARVEPLPDIPPFSPHESALIPDDALPNVPRYSVEIKADPEAATPRPELLVESSPAPRDGALTRVDQIETIPERAVADAVKVEPMRTGEVAGRSDQPVTRAATDAGFDAQRGIDAGETTPAVKSTDPDLLPDALARNKKGGSGITPYPDQIVSGRPVRAQGAETPAPVGRVQLTEDIGATLVEQFSSVARVGKVMQGASAQYNTRTGVLRLRSPAALDDLAHEIGHKFHMQDSKPDVDALVKRNTIELKSYGAGSGKEGDAEAFANLFAAYVMNKGAAGKNFPNAARELDALLREKYPAQFSAVEDARAALDVLYYAPSDQVVSAATVTAEPKTWARRIKEDTAAEISPAGRQVYTWADQQISNYADEFLPVKRSVEELVSIAKDNGVSLNLMPKDDAYILSRHISYSRQQADYQLHYGVLGRGETLAADGAPTLKSGMEKALGKRWTQEQFQDFGTYLTSRHMIFEYGRLKAKEIDRPPGPFSLPDYERAVATYEARYPSFAEGAADVHAFNLAYARRMVDNGLRSEEWYDTISSRKDYVPANRDMTDFGDGQKAKGGTGGNGRLPAWMTKRAGGSDRKVINPLEIIYQRVHDAEHLIAKNNTINALVRHAEAAGPGSGYIIEPIPNHHLTSQKIDVMEVLKMAGKSAGVDEDNMVDILMHAEDMLGESAYATLFRQPEITPGAEPILFAWQNGERKAYRLGDTKFAREIHQTLSVMSPVERDVFVSSLAIFSSSLRLGVTRSIDFPIVNFARDQSTAMLTGGRGYVPFASATRGLADVIMNSPDAREAAAHGVLGGGILTSTIQQSSFGKNVTALVQPNLLSKMAKVFEASEAATRVALYRSFRDEAMKLGMDQENAVIWGAYRANDYIDFQLHGSKMLQVKRLVPFMNANIQGNRKEFSVVKDFITLSRKRARGETLSSTEMEKFLDGRVAVVRTIAMGVVLGAGLAAVNQNNEYWKSAPEWLRDGNFVFALMGRDFTVPKPFGIPQIVINFFERTAEAMFRREPEVAKDWIARAPLAFAPPVQNPLVSMLYDAPANYNRFRGKPIVPYYMQGLESKDQYTAGTSLFARILAGGAAKAGAGIESVIGVDPFPRLSPMKIDYVFNQLGGGLSRDVLSGVDLLMGADRPEKQIYDWPVLRRFTRNLARGNEATNAFYNLVGEKSGEYEMAENTYKYKIRNGERSGAAEYLSRLKDDQKAWVVLNSFGFSAWEKRLHPMMNSRERVGIIGGVTRQILNNNLIDETSLDRRDLTRDRRDAKPIEMTARQRAEAMEALGDLSFITARNAMIAVGAKGTGGLAHLDAAPAFERLRIVSPEAAEELNKRLAAKKLPTDEQSRAAWPEIKKRLLRDGEDADLTGVGPREPKRKK